MRRYVLVILLAVVAFGVAGCYRPRPSGGSPTPAPSGSAEVTASPTPEPPFIEPVPASWRLCENPILGIAMGYPGDWITMSLRPAEDCLSFHPEPFRFTGEYPLLALNAAQTPQTVEEYIAEATLPVFWITVSRESVTINGRDAIRYETRSLGGGVLEPETRFYGYAINRDGRAFVVFTVGRPGEPRYGDWKGVVDVAVDTLTFTP